MQSSGGAGGIASDVRCRPGSEPFPSTCGPFRLEPIDRDTWGEQIGTTGELVAGVAAVLLGSLYIWAMMAGSVSVQ